MEAPSAGLLEIVRNPGKPRNALAFAVAVLAFFAIFDCLLLASPEFGRFYAPYAPVLLAGGGVAVSAVLIAAVSGRLLPLVPDTRSDSENFQELLRSVRNFVVLNDVHTRKGQIAHVLIGAHGVFLIGVDHRRGTFAFDGLSVKVGTRTVPHGCYGDLVSAARYVESKVEHVLERRVRVRAVYVFTRARIGQPNHYAGAIFTSAESLPAVLARGRHTLRPDDVAVVRALLDG